VTSQNRMKSRDHRQRVDPITVEVLRNAFNAIANEMNAKKPDWRTSNRETSI